MLVLVGGHALTLAQRIRLPDAIEPLTRLSA